jgi:uncharacterized membrane protein YhaH (DUF805 family)
MSEKRGSRVRAHLFRIAVYLISFFWLAFVRASLKTISVTEKRAHSHEVAWAILIVGFVPMLATMDRWVKYLPVILGGFTLGTLLATIQGRLLNGTYFPRSIAAALTGLLVGSSLLSQTLTRRNLGIFERVALTAFVTAWMVGFVDGTPRAGLVGISIGFACLAACWAWNRFVATEN